MDTLDGINGRLDVAEENISELQGIIIETMKNEMDMKRIFFLMSTASVSNGATSSKPIYM